MIAVLTGLTQEAGVIQDRSNTLVLCGLKDLQALDQVVPEACAGMLGFSVVGGLSPRVKVGDVCVARGIVMQTAGATITAYPSPAWTDRIVAALAQLRPIESAFFSDARELADTPAKRAALKTATGADVVDMGSYAIEAWAMRHKKPFAVIGAISDGWDQTVTGNAAIMNPDGSPNIAEILREARGDPKLLQVLMQEAHTFVRAIWSLRAAYHLLAGRLWAL